MGFLPTNWRVILMLCVLPHACVVLFLFIYGYSTFGTRGGFLEAFIHLGVLPLGLAAILILIAKPYHGSVMLFFITSIVIVNLVAVFLMLVSYQFRIWDGAILFPVMLAYTPLISIYYITRLSPYTYITKGGGR